MAGPGGRGRESSPRVGKIAGVQLEESKKEQAQNRASLQGTPVP